MLHELYEEYLSPDLRASASNVSELSDNDSRITQCYHDLALRSRNICLDDEPDFKFLERPDVRNTHANAYKDTDIAQTKVGETSLTYQNAIKQQSHYDGNKKLVEIYIEPLKETISETDTVSERNLDPVKEGTQFLMAHYRAQSRGSSVSSLKSTDAPIKSAPNLIRENTFSGHVYKKISCRPITQPKKSKATQGTGRKRTSIKPKSAAGKVESSAFSIRGNEKSTVEESETSVTKSKSTSQMSVTKTRNNSQMNVDTSRSKSQMSFYEHRSTSGFSYTSGRSRKLNSGNVKKSKRPFSKNVSNNASLRMVQANGLCGNDDCSLCLMAKCLNQRQVNSRFGEKFSKLIIRIYSFVFRKF